MKTLRNILIGTLTLFFCIAANGVYGQNAELNELNSDSLYFEGPALFECNIQMPDNYNPDKSYPLVISLHGGGSSFETFKNIWRHFENPRFIMATPEAPYKWLMGDKIGYDWSGWPSGDSVFMKRAIKLTSKYIENLILVLKEKYKVNEVFLLGFSQGSIIAQIAGINNRDLLSGIIILSGPEINHPGKSEIVWPVEENVRSANHLKVFIAHGKSDAIIDIDIAHKSKDIYRKYGYNTSIYEFEGGHTIDKGAMKKIEKWINKQPIK
ncbi:MAG: hypothetical protein HQ522_18625 [Bacteroidetes bacterium]|nr:hypothetical protein [Bacteroidota bacterium]